MKLNLPSNSTSAMTLTGALVTIALLVLLAAILLPALAGARRTNRISCINDLKQTSLSFYIWSSDNNDKYPAQVYATNDAMMKAIANGNAWRLWQTMSNELSTPKILHCPNDRQTTMATNFDRDFQDVNISYFFNSEATNNYPQMILDGDDNISINGKRAGAGILRLSASSQAGWTPERHPGGGNIGLADGSVAQVSSSGLNSALASSNTNSVRLVIP